MSKCFSCGWHGSEDDPLINRGKLYLPLEQLLCKFYRHCRERQQANRDRQDPPGEYATGIDGYPTAPQ